MISVMPAGRFPSNSARESGPYCAMIVASSKWRYSTPNVTAPAATRTVYSGKAGTGSVRYSILPIMNPPVVGVRCPHYGRPMRFALGLPTERPDAFEELSSGAAMVELARAADEAGFDAISVTDHPFPEDRWLK